MHIESQGQGESHGDYGNAREPTGLQSRSLGAVVGVKARVGQS